MDEKLEVFERCSTACAEGAANENNDPKLRAYYAGLALHYDRKADKRRTEISDEGDQDAIQRTHH